MNSAQLASVRTAIDEIESTLVEQGLAPQVGVQLLGVIVSDGRGNSTAVTLRIDAKEPEEFDGDDIEWTISMEVGD